MIILLACRKCCGGRWLGRGGVESGEAWGRGLGESGRRGGKAGIWQTNLSFVIDHSSIVIEKTGVGRQERRRGFR